MIYLGMVTMAVGATVLRFTNHPASFAVAMMACIVGLYIFVRETITDVQNSHS